MCVTNDWFESEGSKVYPPHTKHENNTFVMVYLEVSIVSFHHCWERCYITKKGGFYKNEASWSFVQQVCLGSFGETLLEMWKCSFIIDQSYKWRCGRWPDHMINETKMMLRLWCMVRALAPVVRGCHPLSQMSVLRAPVLSLSNTWPALCIGCEVTTTTSSRLGGLCTWQERM